MQELDASFRAEGSKFRRRDGAMSVSGHYRRFGCQDNHFQGPLYPKSVRFYGLPRREPRYRSPDLTTAETDVRRAVGHQGIARRVVNVIFRVLLNVVRVLL